MCVSKRGRIKTCGCSDASSPRINVDSFATSDPVLQIWLYQRRQKDFGSSDEAAEWVL